MLVDEFDARLAEDVRVSPRYNIAPTQLVPIVLISHGERLIQNANWGLIPSWAKDRSAAARLINARSETVAQKPSFRSAIKRRRCIVPTNGYYEWYRPQHGAKQPFWIHADDGGVLAMAGVFEFWDDPVTHDEVCSMALLTQDAMPNLAQIHDRMPMFLERQAYGAWLDPALTDAAAALALTQLPALESTPISTRVNNARNEGPELLEVVDAEPERLF